MNRRLIRRCPGHCATRRISFTVLHSRALRWMVRTITVIYWRIIHPKCWYRRWGTALKVYPATCSVKNGPTSEALLERHTVVAFLLCLQLLQSTGLYRVQIHLAADITIDIKAAYNTVRDILPRPEHPPHTWVSLRAGQIAQDHFTGDGTLIAAWELMKSFRPWDNKGPLAKVRRKTVAAIQK